MRLHTAAALALIALVPLAPAGMRVYAKLASEDRGEARAAAERILTAAAPPPGARRDGTSGYENRAWEGESLVPIAGWTFETSYRLPRRMTTGAVVSHYRRTLPGWSVREQRVDCRTLSAPPGCDARFAVFRRGDARLELNLAEYIEDDGRTVTQYGVQVSQ